MKSPFRRTAISKAFIAGVMSWAWLASGQTYRPTDWVNDPFCLNPNFGVVGANSSSPLFTNNAVQRGTLYLNSPIGETLKLTQPGDAVSFSGQVTVSGDLNPDGNMQFRFALLYKGENPADTNWLGYIVGNPTGTGGADQVGLYVRNNPNPGIYASGSIGNAMRPKLEAHPYTPGWEAGTYDFSLSVSQISTKAQSISWKLTRNVPGTYSYAGDYTNTFDPTLPPAFDQVGFLGGAALFNSASTENALAFTNLSVTFTKGGDAE